MATSNTADWKKIADEMRAEIEQRRYLMGLAGEHAEQLSETIDALRAEVERLRRIEKLALIWSAYQDDESKANPDLLMQSLDAADALYDAVSARLPSPTPAQCSHATVIVVGDQETCQDCGRARRRTTIRTSAALPERIDLKRFQKAPCYICGYNGPNYYQPEVHECAGLYHEQTNEMP